MEIIEKYKDYFYATFRILLGIGFLSHGIVKFTGGAPAVFSLPWLAGIAEVIVGLLIIIGLLTRPAAILGFLTMAGAYFYVHISAGLFPLTNGGELAWLYLLSFVLIFGMGGRVLSLDNVLFSE